MSLKASFEKKIFQFKRPSGTSRGILTEKLAWFITIWNTENESIKGVGECSIIPGLSPDFSNEKTYENKIKEVVEEIEHYAKRIDQLEAFPSIYFGIETALLDLNNGGKRLYFDTPFAQGRESIHINGLVWMGDPNFMKRQIDEKIRDGFTCIKLKIGAINFNEELAILDGIRELYSAKDITIRVDANGAFSPKEALKKLHDLSPFHIHSIEQPIAPNQHQLMRELCEKSPVPIALDEELIGVYEEKNKIKLLEKIQPQYIILKPSLHGGLKGSLEWIKLANERDIPWWITSALESNIGLDAIAQFTSTFNVSLPQGLGTGALYTNNIPSSLTVINGHIRHMK